MKTRLTAVVMILAVCPLIASGQSNTNLINIGSPIQFVAPTFPAGVTPSNEKVRLRFTVREDGAVDTESIEVIETSNVLYNQSAVDALSQFKYKPRIVDGKAVATPGSRTLVEYKITIR